MDQSEYTSYAPQSPDLSSYHSNYPPDPPPSVCTQQYSAAIPPSTYQQAPYYSPQQPHPNAQYPTNHNSTAVGNNSSMRSDDDEDYAPGSASSKRAATRGTTRKAKKGVDAEGDSVAPGVAEGIEVKTKFPVARIKRIMQADEDVGKVAQVTPVVVSKALELFMISLVCKASQAASERSSKRVTAAHLKQAIAKDKRFDFLEEIIAKVADAPAPNEKTEDGDEAAEGKRKRGGGRGKKRKDTD
ncbi:MAG: hypothetical protein M1835_005777 [Candelina submexicana]|nr:MAG: hypothetical protein M1835_005777 [Candelina submexicana]